MISKAYSCANRCLAVVVLGLFLLNCNSTGRTIIQPGLYHRSKDGNANLIKIQDDNRFIMQVNLCFGWGLITGRWKITEGNLVLTEEKRDFDGFQDGAPKEFTFRIISPNSFIYKGEARFCFNADNIDTPDGNFIIMPEGEAREKIRTKILR